MQHVHSYNCKIPVCDSIASITNLQHMLSVSKTSQLHHVAFSTIHDNLLGTYEQCSLFFWYGDNIGIV